MNSESLNDIKIKIQTSAALDEKEKKEWLTLLPRMTDIQLGKLDRVLSAKAKESAAIPKRDEIAAAARSGLAMTEKEEVPRSDRQNMVFPKSVDMIRNLTLAELRAAPSVYVFLSNLQEQIKKLLAERQARPMEIERALEGCPLYRSYVEAGMARISGRPSTVAALTREEFDALTDFRKGLHKLLN